LTAAEREKQTERKRDRQTDNCHTTYATTDTTSAVKAR